MLLLAIAGALDARADEAIEAPSLLEREQLSGDWGGLRPRLVAEGFEPYLVYTGSMWSNVAGGLRTGTEFNGYLDLGFGLDLGKLGAWDGLHLQASWHWFQGRQPSQVLVGVNVAQAVNPWEASNAFRFFDLYLGQDFGDDGVLRVGQIAVDSDFMISRYASTLLNSTFSDLPSQNANLDVPVYPVAGPGVYATSGLGEHLRGRLGFYTADTARDVASNHGLEWRLGNNAGYAVFAELTGSAEPDGLPGAYTLGGYYASVRAPKIRGQGLVYNQWSFWLMVDQALLVDASGDPKVGVFARFSYSPSNDADFVALYGDTGLNVFGPIPGRPDDIFALGGSIGTFSEQYRAVTPGLGKGEGILELTYQIAATPWLSVQPDLQLVIDPSEANGRDATVIGLEMVLTF